MNINFDQSLRAFAALMQMLFFLLMCAGLLLASTFLYMGLVTGDNWVAVCGILFAADRLGSAIAGRMSQ